MTFYGQPHLPPSQNPADLCEKNEDRTKGVPPQKSSHCQRLVRRAASVWRRFHGRAAFLCLRVAVVPEAGIFEAMESVAVDSYPGFPPARLQSS